jgi:hypothetical protein
VRSTQDPELKMRVVPRAVAAMLTVLLHLLILFALLRVTTSVVKPPPPPVGQGTTVDKLYDAGEQLVSVDIGPGLSARGFACAGSSYVGVGVTADPGTERIILVGEDTPAARLGCSTMTSLNPAVWGDSHQEESCFGCRSCARRDHDRAGPRRQDLHRIAPNDARNAQRRTFSYRPTLEKAQPTRVQQ